MLNQRDWQTLREEGFYNFEIRVFHFAKPDVDIGSPVWVSTRASRFDWVNKKLDDGWSRREIYNAIRRFYRRRHHNPFEFLKIEYQQPKRLKDFQLGLTERRAKRRARKVLPGYYPRTQYSRSSYQKRR